MANVRYGNTFYIDTQYSTSKDELSANNLKITGLLFAPTSTSSAVLQLGDGNSTNTKLYLHGDSTGRSIFINLTDSPIVFANSVRPIVLTNAVVTCILRDTKG